MRIIYWYTDILQQLKQQTKRKKNTFWCTNIYYTTYDSYEVSEEREQYPWY